MILIKKQIIDAYTRRIEKLNDPYILARAYAENIPCYLCTARNTCKRATAANDKVKCADVLQDYICNLKEKEEKNESYTVLQDTTECVENR